MQARTTFGWKLLATSALVALAGCTNTTTTAGNTPTVTARTAGDPAGGRQSISEVSEALGQRLDGMVSARQTGR